MIRKRLVRLHVEDRPGVEMPSFEGILVSRFAGQYQLVNARLVTGPEQQTALEGRVFVPRERVVFVQDIGGAR